MGGIDVPEQQPIDSPVTSPRRHEPSPCPAHIDPEAWNRAPEAPGFELFSQDSDDVEGDANKVAAGIPAVEVPDSAPSVAAETPSVVDQTEPCVMPIDSSAKGDGSSGMVTREKKTRFNRAAKEELTPPKSNKIRSRLAFDHHKSVVGAAIKFLSCPPALCTPSSCVVAWPT